MYRLYRYVPPNEASQSSNWGVTASKPCSLQFGFVRRWISDFSQALGGFPLFSSFCALGIHSRGIKKTHNMSDEIFLSKNIFRAFCLSLLAGRDFLLVLSHGTTGHICWEPRRETSPLALKTFLQFHTSQCIYFCRKVPYPTSTMSAVVCRDSHLKYRVFTEQMNQQLLLARDCYIFVATLLPQDFYLHIY